MAGGVRPGDRHGRLLRAPRRPPGLRRTRRGRGHPVPLPRLAVERRGPQRLHPVRAPPQPRPPDAHLSGGRAQRVDLHLARQRAAASRSSTRRTSSPASRTEAARPTTTRSSGCSAKPWNCTRSTCSRTASTSRTSSTCTRRRSCRCSRGTTSPNPVSYVDFTITFEGDDQQSIDDVNSGVEAINGGSGIAVTKSWGMIDNRTISAITPVDERTSDVRFMVYIGRTPGKDSPRAAEPRPPSSATRSSGSSARTSTSGHTSGTPTRPHCRRPSTKASPQFASGPCSSIPTAAAAAPRIWHPRSERAEFT